jgi:hypothetical protein
MASQQFMAERVTGLTSNVFSEGKTLKTRAKLVHVYSTPKGHQRVIFEDDQRDDVAVSKRFKMPVRYVRFYSLNGGSLFDVVIKPKKVKPKVRVFKSNLNKYQVLSDWTDAEICEELSERSKFCGEMFERVNCKPHKKKKSIKMF